MLSGRSWFERFPRQLRLFVALLALLSLVAPTWHICELGGHVHSMSGAAHHHAPQFQRSASGALICFCAPRHNEENSSTSRFHFAARMTTDCAAQCLAALLGSMPGMWATPTRLPRVCALASGPPAVSGEFVSRRFVRTVCGRGPPVDPAFTV